MANTYREQIADLILKDSDNQDLVVVSPLNEEGTDTVSFVVGKDDPEGARYRVTVKIEEI